MGIKFTNIAVLGMDIEIVLLVTKCDNIQIILIIHLDTATDQQLNIQYNPSY